MKKLLTIVIVLLAVCAGGYWGYSLAAKTNSAPDSAIQAQSIEEIQAKEGKPVKVESIIQKDLALTQTFYGSVAPYAEADIQGKTGGTVTYLKGVEGDRVTEGDIIVRFDDSSTQLQLQQAIASKNAAEQSVKQAQSNYATLQKTLDRYQQLFKDGLIPQQNLDELQNQSQAAQAGLESAKQQVASAETQVEMLQNTLRDMTIKAPFSGIIDKKNFNLNEITGARAVIYHLVDLDQVYVEVEIPESHISQIQEQMNVAISFDSLKEQQFTGHIERILPTGNQQRRIFTAKVLVENPEHRIKPGMFARVEVELEHMPDALVFAKKALLKEGDDYYVFKIIDNQAHKVPVDIALREGDTVAVRSAELASQDRVVVEGAHLVTAEDRVKVLN